MKKIATYLMLMLAVVFTACGTKGEADKVSEKISSGQSLDAADYTVIISYLGNFAEKAQPIQDKIDNANGATPDLDSQLAQLKSEYPHIDSFEKVLETANANEVGADNMSLLGKYASLQWFTAPSWYVDVPDPAVAGEVVEAPQDSSNVIAGGVEQAVRK